LVRLNPSLFVTGSMPAALAAKQASNSIAIVGIGLAIPSASDWRRARLGQEAK